jgi:hypothetical protein
MDEFELAKITFEDDDQLSYVWVSPEIGDIDDPELGIVDNEIIVRGYVAR